MRLRRQGSKVVLREKRRTDAPNDYAWSIDEELCKLDAARPSRLSFQDAMMRYEDELLYPARRRRRFGIDALDGSHIGNCMVYDIDHAKGEAELGIMIGDRRYWNKAFGVEAVTLLLDYGFDEVGLRRIYLHTLDWNVRAQKSFQRAGFTSLGKVYRNGQTFLVMEVRKEDWESRSRERAGVESGAD